MATVLGEQDYKSLKEQLKKIDELKAAVQKAKQAGIDVGEREQVLAENERKIKSLLQTYFPGR